MIGARCWLSPQQIGSSGLVPAARPAVGRYPIFRSLLRRISERRCIVKVMQVHKKKSRRVGKSSTDRAGSFLNRIQILGPIGINAPGHPNRFAFDEARAGDGSCMRTWL